MPPSTNRFVATYYEELLADELSPSGIELRRSDFTWKFGFVCAANGAQRASRAKAERENCRSAEGRLEKNACSSGR
jgi:hypothetical protein